MNKQRAECVCNICNTLEDKVSEVFFRMEKRLKKHAPSPTSSALYNLLGRTERRVTDVIKDELHNFYSEWLD